MGSSAPASPKRVGEPDRAELEGIVRHLAAIERPSASPGEREAAEWIAGRLRDIGLDARVEEERAHGTYWWPLGILSAIAGLAGLTGRRAIGTLAGFVGALGVWDDVGLWREWTRRALPKRPTWNVVAEAGEPAARRTLLVVAHHDAAHSGLIFDSRLPRALMHRFPERVERARSWPQLLRAVFAGPALVGLGSLLGWRRVRRVGALMSFGSAATMAEIGMRGVVPGANDNLSGVATVLGVARALAEKPVDGVRVMLVSTGSEESFEEGMAAFMRRHAPELPVDDTFVLAVDIVGSPRLVLPEGEGMLVHRAYDEGLKGLVAESADEAGVPLIREHWLSFASDALVGMRRGYRSALIASFDELKLPANYHWPTDTAENVDYGTVADAVRVVEELVRRLGAGAPVRR